MKILQLVTQRQFRGAETFAGTLSEHLLKKGCKVLFVGIYKAPEHLLIVDGAVNLDLDGDRKFLSLSTIRKLITLIKSENPDIIQANGSDTLKYAIISRMLAGAKMPVIYRNISIVSSWIRGNIFKKQFYRFLFSKVDFVTSVGYESLNDFTSLFNYSKLRTGVIRRGIPMNMINKDAARRSVITAFNLSPNARLVVHAGTFTTEKNHEFLLKVFSKTVLSHPEFKLILIGEGKRFNYIKEMIVKLGLQSTVILAGFSSEIGKFLSAADICVLCSKIEGIPGVILEAGVQKTPTLAINVGGVSEVVRNGETGVLLNTFDPDAFVVELIRLLGDPAYLSRLGENAHQMVLKNFDADENANKFLELYRKLLNNRNGDGCTQG